MDRKLFFTKLLLRLFLLSFIVDAHEGKQTIYKEDRRCDYPFCPECSRSGCYWTVFDNQTESCQNTVRGLKGVVSFVPPGGSCGRPECYDPVHWDAVGFGQLFGGIFGGWLVGFLYNCCAQRRGRNRRRGYVEIGEGRRTWTRAFVIFLRTLIRAGQMEANQGAAYRDNAADERAGDDIPVHHGREVGRLEERPAEVQAGVVGVRRRSPPNQQQQQQQEGPQDHDDEPIAEARLGERLPGRDEDDSGSSSEENDEENPRAGGAQDGPRDGVQVPAPASPLVQEAEAVRQHVRQAAQVSREKTLDLKHRRLI